MGKLLDELGKATPSDLEQIDGEIKGLESRLEMLRMAYKIVWVKIHGKPARKKPEKKAKESTLSMGGMGVVQSRRKIAEYLRAAGTSKVTVLADHFKAPATDIRKLVDNPWFRVDQNDAVILMPEGRKQLMED